MRPRLFLLLIAVVGLFVQSACSASGGTGGAPVVDQAWARPAAAGAESAAYLTITGAAGTADRLLSASSPGASMVGLHEATTDAAGMTGMQPMEGIDVPAGGTVKLEPGAFHLMIEGVTSELVVGGTLELDLVFEHAGKVVVQAEIRQG